MINKFTIDYVSDSEHEYLTAEISYDGQILCQISQDKGIDKIEIEFFHLSYLDVNQHRFKFLLDDLFKVLDEAIKGFS